MNNPKLSVVIPAYNCGNYIEKCLNSVLQQDYENFEIICVDDNSKDNTYQIIERYSNIDNRIKLIKNETNKGVGISRRNGLFETCGDWILFMDSDDYYEPKLFSNLVNIIQNNKKLNIIEFRYNTVDETGEVNLASWLDRGNSGIKNIENENILLDTALWNKCYNKEFLLKFELYETEKNYRTYCGEISAHICSFLLAREIYYLDFVGYNWTIHSNSLCHNPKKDEVFLKGVWCMLEDLKSELLRLGIFENDNYIQYCATVLSWHIYEKFSYSIVYKNYYNKVRKFFIKNRRLLEKNNSFKKIIKTPWLLMVCRNIFNENFKFKKFKILVAYHKPDKLYKNSVLIPIHCGRSIAMTKSKDGVISKNDYKWLLKHTTGDDTGDNISYLNREVNEWSAIYWAFKNYDKLGNPDYVGLCHYRRFFKLRDIFHFNISLSFFYSNYFLNLIFNKYKFLFRKGFEIKNPKELTFDPFQAIIGLSTDYHPILYRQYLNFKKEQKYYCNNMFIMSKKDFFDMCNELVPIIEDFFKMEKSDINDKYLAYMAEHYDCTVYNRVKKMIEENNEFPRMIAYIMEYLTSFYFMHLRDLYKEKAVECDIKEYPYRKILP